VVAHLAYLYRNTTHAGLLQLLRGHFSDVLELPAMELGPEEGRQVGRRAGERAGGAERGERQGLRVGRSTASGCPA
jgi:hypothetical protein